MEDLESLRKKVLSESVDFEKEKTMKEFKKDMDNFVDDIFHSRITPQNAWYLCNCWFCRFIHHPLETFKRKVDSKWVEIHEKKFKLGELNGSQKEPA